GFAPALRSEEEALTYLTRAIELAGYKPGKEISLGLDCAASESFDRESSRYIEKKKQNAGQTFLSRSREEQVEYLVRLSHLFPIDSIEDGMDQNDWTGWRLLTEQLSDRVQIVGDDLFVTNSEYLQKGIDMKAANAILIKLNQIGTL